MEMVIEMGLHGERIPMYWNWLCEKAAIEAFLCGDWGALTVDEIAFMKEAAKEAHVPYVHP